MTHFASFAAAAATWQNFYLLLGTAAAALVALTFVAVTFAATIITPETSQFARAFIDPPFGHFVQVLVTACLMAIPTMGPTLLGVLLLTLGAGRLAGLWPFFRKMHAAHRANHDIELSDWLSGIALPLVCHLLMTATGVAFVCDDAVAFNALAIVTLAMLLLGIYCAWELMVWMALTRKNKS